MHMRCATHILNLMVQDGTSTIQPVVNSIRELMRNIISSGSRFQMLNRILSELNLQPKRELTLNCPTRWNSTFEMLKEALNLKEALSRFGDTYTMSGPTLNEWKQAQDVVDFFEAFLDATKIFLIVRRPSSHTYVKGVWGIMAYC
jgi:hypothetical protein